MATDGGQSFDNLSKPQTPNPTEISVLRKENDRKTTENKQAQIKELFDKLPEISLVETSRTEGGQIQNTFPLANRMKNIFESSAFVVGTEKAQKEMLEIANRVIAQKEAGQSIKPWGATNTETFLLQLEAKGAIPRIKTLDKLTIFPKSTLRIIKNLIKTK
jgi:hypothetical protein